MDINIPEEILPDSTFLCGPSQAHPDIRNTPVSDMLFERSHRAPDVSYEGLYAEAISHMKELLRVPDDYLLLFFLGGASPALDSAAWNSVTDSISGYRFGSFSNLWGKKIASYIPGDIIETYSDVKEGEQFPTDPLDYNASFIFLTPNETSTGVAIPDELLEKVYAQASDSSIVGWDCTSCAGARLLPASNYDIMVFSLQKSFGCAGGTGVMVLSPDAVDRAEETAEVRNIPHSLRLSGKKMPIDRVRSKSQTLNTPCTPNIWMANEASKKMLEAGGLEAMDLLVKDHAQTLWDWIDSSDMLEPYVEDEKFRSNVTITVRVDESIDAMDISKALMATGKPNLQDGIKKYSSVEGNLLRIACFPFIDFDGTEQFEKLTAAVDFIMDALK